MFKDFLNKYVESQAAAKETGGGYVDFGYGQVEPNHLSAQKTGQIFAQLPADASINVLEQGQFVKYDYANEVCNFIGEGEWMLVYNETKLYRDGQWDCEFALVKDDYQARLYSPFDQSTLKTGQARYYDGKDANGNSSITVGTGASAKTYNFDDVTKGGDYYEPYYNSTPYSIEGKYKAKKMPAGTSMVPRVLKTNVGDHYTTNFIMEKTLTLGDKLYVGDKGILSKTKKETADTNGAVSGTMVWQVVKVYTMPDGQKGVKIMRIA